MTDAHAPPPLQSWLPAFLSSLFTQGLLCSFSGRPVRTKPVLPRARSVPLLPHEWKNPLGPLSFPEERGEGRGSPLSRPLLLPSPHSWTGLNPLHQAAQPGTPVCPLRLWTCCASGEAPQPGLPPPRRAWLPRLPALREVCPPRPPRGVVRVLKQFRAVFRETWPRWVLTTCHVAAGTTPWPQSWGTGPAFCARVSLYLKPLPSPPSPFEG